MTKCKKDDRPLDQNSRFFIARKEILKHLTLKKSLKMFITYSNINLMLDLLYKTIPLNTTVISGGIF